MKDAMSQADEALDKVMSLHGGLDMYTFPTERYDDGEPPEGRKVIYLDDNGYDGQREHARKFFQKGTILTIKEIYIGRSSSDVVFKEHPNQRFNTVMFADVEEV